MRQVFAKTPSICAPLTASKLADLIHECQTIVTKEPDIIEWRVDFFDGIHETDQLVEALTELRQTAGAIPIIFTFRSAFEGGNQDLLLSSTEKIQIYTIVCQSQTVEYIDFELSNPSADIELIRKISRENDILLILSYHNFTFTPDETVLRDKFLLAKKHEGDVVKLAVMPNSLEDVLNFMKITLNIQKQIHIPMINIAMGELGLASRLFGWMFGSQLTFAVGENSSAPGQIPIADVKTIIELTRQSIPASTNDSQ